MLNIGSVVRHKRVRCAMTIVQLLEKTAECLYWNKNKREYVTVHLPLKELF